MDQICLAVPVLPGKNADARDCTREAERARKLGGRRAERRTGIVKEAWHLARAPTGARSMFPESGIGMVGFASLTGIEHPCRASFAGTSSTRSPLARRAQVNRPDRRPRWSCQPGSAES